MDGEYIAEPQFREAKDFSDGLASVDTLWDVWDALYGYLDTDGNFAIAPRFVLASKFSEGLAYVVKENGREESRAGYINKDGEFVIIFNHASSGGLFSEGLASVSAHGKRGVINKSGDWIVYPSFDIIGPFSEGLAKIKSNNRWGFIDKYGEFIIPLQFGEVRDFSEGMAAFSHTPILSRDSSGKATKINRDRKFGFINQNGDWVIPPSYDIVESFKGGLAWVCVLGDYSGYIDKDNNLVHYIKLS